MSGFTSFCCVRILPGGGDAAVAEGFLDHFWVSGCKVKKVAAGMPQGMAGDSRPFEAGLQ